MLREQVYLDTVWAAAKNAPIDGFIVDELRLGIKTVEGERGVRVSGGQRQRTGIARAPYRDPDVVVFDEATISLNTTTEQHVMDAL